MHLKQRVCQVMKKLEQAFLNHCGVFLVLFCSFFFFFFLSFYGHTPAHGVSQARGSMGTIAASLRHSNRNTGSEPHLQSTPQLMAMQDP